MASNIEDFFVVNNGGYKPMKLGDLEQNRFASNPGIDVRVTPRDLINMGLIEEPKPQRGIMSSILHRGRNDGQEWNGGCYLTTACIDEMGLSDDCFELETLRDFREEIIQSPSGKQAVKEYDLIAPEIVEAIGDNHQVWQGVYRNIRKAVSMVLSGDKDGAFNHYKQMTEELAKYTI